MTSRIRVGTRRSPLALAQTKQVVQALCTQGICSENDISIVPMETLGDRITQHNFAEFGGKGVFTDQLDRALLNNEIDLVVHAAKDLPTLAQDGICLAAVLPRGSTEDVLVAKTPCTIQTLPHGARVGTISLRRRALLLRLRPDLNIVPVRGNVATRISKVDAENGAMDAICLARAGLERVDLTHRISYVFSHTELLPAAAQGTIGITARSADLSLCSDLLKINDHATRQATHAERSFLRELGGSCQMPLAAHAAVNGFNLSLRCIVVSLDGTELVDVTEHGSLEHAIQVGEAAGQRVKQQASETLLRELKESVYPPSFCGTQS